MTQRLPRILLIACLALASAKVLSAQQSADSVDHFSFDLDTPAGNFSFWRIERLRHDRLSGRIAIGTIRRHTRFAPAIRIQLLDGANVAELRIWAPSGRPPLVAVVARTNGNVQTDSTVYALRVTSGDTLSIALDWSRAGVLRAALAGEAHEILLPFEPTQFQVLVSTGQVTSDSLMLVRRR